ncbi:MAG: peptidylprolyl isomerase [Hyphomicrobiales bacterium]|nr:peptidylprolyl isomerase [Hyphomicrobiales bacterium]MCP4999880.1 peptidylprolyl isomerase [Hyphomicrobiales bacterium]
MPVPTATELAASDRKWSAVRDVVEKRCVVCHGCYDAPCQLKLSSPDGLLRGASKERVYAPSRLEDAPLTRLGIDAKTEKGWRELGFFPVQHNPAMSKADPSVLSRLMDLGHANPPPENGPLPESVDLNIRRKLSCPAPDQTDDYMKDHPHGGMPFATARLADDEYDLLSTWAGTGAPLPGYSRDLPDVVTQKITDIETYLNSKDFAQLLVSRYIYEHLFLAHLHIEGDDPDHFFRMIRSATPSGETADEIATRRPFDDPGKAPYFYRIIPIEGTILHKEHMVYEIGPRRLARYRTLFDPGNLTVKESPPYSDAAGGNPFTTFAGIPNEGRYRFLLDDALFFVRSFIRGPVCYGQVAVDVIEDRFWVAFLDPDSDLSITDTFYLQEAALLLELPVSAIGGDLEQRASKFLSEGPAEYLRFRDERYRAAASYAEGPTYNDVWDGDGTNIDARLTIYRHFDNASVVTGFVGAVPETAWVIDYPLLERIYYDLVAGFDVFGSVEHQLTTRLYMDGLRREGETIFLSFLPPDVREPMHDEWYRGPLATLVDWLKEQPVDTSTPTGIAFDTVDPKAEFLETLLDRGPQLWPRHDPINRCSGTDCAPPDTVAGRLRALADHKAPFIKFLPDLVLLLVETGSYRSEIFTLVHDKAHSNVAFLFREENRREPDDDRLTIVAGQFVSYPNFYFRVDASDLPAFIADLQGVSDQTRYMAFVKTYGVRRGSPDFWPSVDAVQAEIHSQDALQAGLLDLNRYKDPKSADKVE